MSRHVISHRRESDCDRSNALFVLAAIVLCAAFLPNAVAQEKLREWGGENSGDAMGASVAGIGDINGDGFDDVIVGAPNYGLFWYSRWTGRVYVYSGRNGVLLDLFDGESSGDQFGSAVSGLGDVDDDGFPDFAVSSANHSTDSSHVGVGRVYVYSGRHRAFLFSVDGENSGDKFGRSLCALGDINRDHHADFVVGADGSDGGTGNPADERGRAYVISGKTGGHLITLDGAATSDRFGVVVASAGDVDIDGFGDFAVTAEGATTGGRYFGCVYVYSGPTGSLLYKIMSGQDPNSGDVYDALGTSLCSLGDIDGDGHSDLLIGAPRSYSSFTGNYTGLGLVISGKTGRTVSTVSVDFAMGCGTSVACLGDVDGDAVPDFAVGVTGTNAGPNSQGSTWLISGATRNALFEVLGFDEQLGFSLSGAGDVDGDGTGDLLVGSSSYFDSTGSTRGRAMVFSGSLRPLVTSITPDRTDHAASSHRYGRPDAGAAENGGALAPPVTATIAGQFFSRGNGSSVVIGGQPARDVTIVSDTQLACTVPENPEPGLADVAVTNDFGTGTLAGGFAYTPAILPVEGDLEPGGYWLARYLCDPRDSILGIIGVPPPVSFPVGPYDGTLQIAAPAQLFLIRHWPFDVFLHDVNIPNDPAFHGRQFLLQALVGDLWLPHVEAAWTNAVLVDIE